MIPSEELLPDSEDCSRSSGVDPMERDSHKVAPEGDRRVAVLAGATGGIGPAIAHRLASDGFRLVLLGRNREAMERVVGDLPGSAQGATTVQALEFSDPGAIRDSLARVIQQTGRIDALIGNLGGWSGKRPGDFLTKEVHDLRTEIDTNLVLPVMLAHAVLPEMVRRGHGRLVFVSSVAGLVGLPGHSAYAAAKAGLMGFARQIAYEFGGRGITANCVAPGAVLTERVEELLHEEDPGIAAFVAGTPTARLTTVAEIAGSVAFLVGEDAGQINGQTLVVDGGMTVAGLSAR